MIYLRFLFLFALVARETQTSVDLTYIYHAHPPKGVDTALTICKFTDKIALKQILTKEFVSCGKIGNSLMKYCGKVFYKKELDMTMIVIGTLNKIKKLKDDKIIRAPMGN